MKRRKKIKLIQVPCRRCGKPVSTLNRPVYTSQSKYDKFSGICQDCITPEEKQIIESPFKE